LDHPRRVFNHAQFNIVGRDTETTAGIGFDDAGIDDKRDV
jgi:hypothetical protein